MRVTFEIDDELLASMKEYTGSKTNEETILYALNHMAAMPWMRDFYSRSLCTPDELADALIPGYDPDTYLDNPPPPDPTYQPPPRTHERTTPVRQ
ncbi:hypothetical protein AXK11_00160 [Cephaloticoccus primus]|uniref:Uncharacterized protein n=1 Tax=Cephaloticoccus primus TaxID=1548207 RepID=A0A139SSZ6_9BACT|nr:hypothetical protein [Cephaloticoccus primus]KXU37686.1 hypothetical protein AXK11_00160 [Cephaloticoccus primus]